MPPTVIFTNILPAAFLQKLPIPAIFFYYSVFHRLSQAKFVYGGSILSSSQFLLLPQLPQKIKFAFKVVKIIILLPEI
jgi:hypothetical protein